MDSYYISFERSGGFAGITQTLELRSDTLSLEDQDHLSKLVDSSGFFDLKPIQDSGLPDQFNYNVTIKSNSQEKTIQISERDISDNLRPLIDFLTDKLRRR